MRCKQLKPNGENATLKEIETAQRCSPTQEGSSRLQAIRALLLDVDRTTVAKIFNVTQCTLLNWMIRFNRYGVDGLIDKPRWGRPRKLARAVFQQQIVPLIEQPSDAGQCASCMAISKASFKLR